MSVKIFVNLPIADQAKSIAFFEALGFKHNPKFTSEDSTCIVFGDDVYAMLISHDFFKTTSKREVADTATTAEAVLALGVDSRDEVDSLVDKAVAAGGREGETQDHGFMYGRGFTDLDGHQWEVFWMDPAAAT